MTWTYNLATLATTPKDQVRLLTGDTLSTDQQMQDEEIAYFLTKRSTVYGAAAECCRTLAAKFSRSVDAAAGDTKNAFSQMAKAYTAKALELESKAAMFGSAAPYAGGISFADKQQNEGNTDRVPPQFNIGLEDNFLPISPAGQETPDAVT